MEAESLYSPPFSPLPLEESPFLPPPLPPAPTIGISLLLRLFLREMRIAHIRAAAPQTNAMTAITMTAIAHPGSAEEEDDELLLLPLFLSLLLFVFVEFVVLVMFVVLLLPGGANSIFVMETDETLLKSIYIHTR